MTKEILYLFETVVQDKDMTNRLSLAIEIKNHVISLEAKIAEL